ncbi:uncharacterized protein LOC121711314 isoform X3 [Alosa sapidissima]|uniref:uncharacterized protein LOC121711314 isoform X3 n=1 Tax=Alosa sapidissima TaxID=34773 RepID=UPI001C0805E6|nr:uncharacterized protein LOC121711314 isoform X3 [Alosa sapidissima]
MEKVARLERKKKRDNATWTDEQEEASWHVHADDALLTADEPEENMVPQEAYNSLKFSRDCTEYNIPSAPPLQPVKPLYSNAVMVVDKKTSQIFCITTLLFTALHVQGVRGYWIRDSPQGERFDVMTYGRVRTDNTKRAERMSPNHCCSLGIANVTAEDAGEYYCGPGGGEISLSILDISASPSRTDSDVSLSCLLHTHKGCEKQSFTDKIHLSWIDEKGSPLQESADRQIQNTSACHTTLKESHLHQREKTWSCQLTTRWRWLKIVATYTMLDPDPTGRSPGLMMESDEMGKAKKGKSSASLEIPIRLTMFFILLILPVVIGIVHVVKRKRQNVKEPLEDTELQDLK